MKSKTDRLHQLIHRLSGSEKRYFKLQAERHTVKGKNNFILLFDAIEKQKVYDESKLKLGLKDPALSRHLAAKKVHLFDLILKALHSYHSGSSISLEILEDLKSVSILYNKGLYDSCNKIVDKTYDRCLSTDKYEQVLEILEWKRRLVFAAPANTRMQLLDIGNKKEETLLKLNNINGYLLLLDQIQQYNLTMGSIRDKSQLVEIRKILRQPLMEHEKKAITFTSLHTYFRILSSWYALNEDLEMSLSYRKKTLHLFEERPEMIREYPDIYLSMYNNTLIIASQLKKSKDLEAGIKELKDIVAGKYELPAIYVARALETSLLFSADLLLIKQKFNSLDSFSAEFESGLADFGDLIRLQRKMLLYIQLGIVHFWAGRFREALHYLNIAQHNPDWERNEDSRVLMRMLNLIIHFELGHDDLIEYLVKSDERFYVKRKRYHSFESVLLKAMRLLSKHPEKEQQQAIFQKLSQDITYLSKDPHESAPLQDFDYQKWIRNKLI